MVKFKKVLSVLEGKFIKMLLYINTGIYMKHYIKYLKKIGVEIIGTPNYISNDVYFDGKDYKSISIGNNVTISREVMLLTHDYSMYTVVKELDVKNIDRFNNSNLLKVEGITIGDNSFIGARVSILPGTIIGKNVLIGACSVVKGTIPDNSIVVGNPAKIIGQTSEWINNKIKSA